MEEGFALALTRVGRELNALEVSKGQAHGAGLENSVLMARGTTVCGGGGVGAGHSSWEHNIK